MDTEADAIVVNQILSLRNRAQPQAQAQKHNKLLVEPQHHSIAIPKAIRPINRRFTFPDSFRQRAEESPLIDPIRSASALPPPLHQAGGREDGGATRQNRIPFSPPLKSGFCTYAASSSSFKICEESESRRVRPAFPVLYLGAGGHVACHPPQDQQDHRPPFPPQQLRIPTPVFVPPHRASQLEPPQMLPTGINGARAHVPHLAAASLSPPPYLPHESRQFSHCMPVEGYPPCALSPQRTLSNPAFSCNERLMGNLGPLPSPDPQSFVSIETPQSIGYMLHQQMVKKRSEAKYGKKVQFTGPVGVTKVPICRPSLRDTLGTPKHVWSDWEVYRGDVVSDQELVQQLVLLQQLQQLQKLQIQQQQEHHQQQELHQQEQQLQHILMQQHRRHQQKLHTTRRTYHTRNKT